ncbi:heat-inducible transcriptional repressor HrcA [Marinicrinis lubricantis]|uniref:Heat-inducible transcription repressor HrcA n=1 Tax=Marinicrinis lubricantis TaxID=2086470 RepID=A0ABW1IUR7_9BACL
MLTDRQRLILHAIIDDYIRSAEPVGSRSISKRGDVGFSPATIRNEMSDLEELGYLEQPHTSAGRVPSHKGYRYYVDHLLQLNKLTSHDLDTVRFFFAEKKNQTEKVIQHVASILSGLTNYTSIVMGPDIHRARLKHIQLVPLNEDTAVAIIVSSMGQVENKIVSIPRGLPVSELEKFVNLLNHKMKDVPFNELRSKLFQEIRNELILHVERYDELLHIVDTVMESNNTEDRLFLSGATNMLVQPEFKDVDKLKSILDLLDETEAVAQLFTSAGNGIQVRIGKENDNEAIHQCSFITATYSVEGRPFGTIGILGPTRMEYGRVISLLDYLSKDLAVLLSRWYG